jgi:hypothetical protein
MDQSMALLRFQIMKKPLLLIGLFVLSPPALAQEQKRPSLVPPGWNLVSGKDERGRRFMSSDGPASARRWTFSGRNQQSGRPQAV